MLFIFIFMQKFSALVVLMLHILTASCLANLTTDQSALLIFKTHIARNDVLLTHNWSATTSCCSWIGVTCGVRHRRVVALNLPNMGLTGTIPPHLGNLSFLASLDLSNNSFHGHLPHELSFLHRLKHVHLGSNYFTGKLPRWFGNLTKLQLLYLYENQFYGQIPSAIFKCTQLQNLSFSVNNFTGNIPREIGNLTMLRELYLGSNDLEGVIPEEMGNLVTLETLNMQESNLTGSIPHTIFNISTMQEISLHSNNFLGQLPSTIGIGLPNLENLFLWGNKLGGVIPNSISNASKLTILALSRNSFIGSPPDTLGDLKHLDWFNVAYNFLTTESSTPHLKFLNALTNCKYLTSVLFNNNPLGGVLPISIGNFSSSLDKIYAHDCKLRGSIPKEIGNLSNLIILDPSNNEFTGSIPTTLGRLQKLQLLSVSNNRLQGFIPHSLCRLESLGFLHLDGNNLSGSIPTCVGNLSSLRYLNLGSNKLTSVVPSTLWSLSDILELNLSTNYLTGSLPVDVGNLKVVTKLDFSWNQLYGNIPSIIGSLRNLVSLNLTSNRLKGPIPQSFGNLISLEFLDISNNNLSEVIPKSMEALSHLSYLNLSFNQLEGEIPSEGPFANFSDQSFMMNKALCGAARLHIRPCKTDQQSPTIVPRLKYILPTVALILVLLSLILVLIRHRKGHVKSPSQAPFSPLTWKKISYHELLQATNGFCESNLLGMGSFGSVYRGILSDGMNVAVKVFNLQAERAFKSFETECEVLRNIRHRNIIKIISSCVNDDFKCFILEYMPNGSLEKWLYSLNYCLDILQRLNIMIDIASALEYLHHNYSTLVVHCDLKPSNVLLDEDMVAHVGDFGIAKLFGEDEFMAHTKTLATIGYMAPEYGSEGIVSSRGDVYSFSILMMETFTRKKPMDEMFFGEMSLKHWVKESVPHAVTEVIDANLLRREEEHFDAKKDCIENILELALDCSVDAPEERIEIKDVLATLKKIRNKFQLSVEGTQRV